MSQTQRFDTSIAHRLMPIYDENPDAVVNGDDLRIFLMDLKEKLIGNSFPDALNSLRQDIDGSQLNPDLQRELQGIINIALTGDLES